MDVVNFRERYDKEVSAIEFDIIANIAMIVSEHGLVKFKKKNCLKWKNSKITGILFQNESMFFCLGDKLVEVDDNCDEFSEMCVNPYTLIEIYESLVSELELNTPSAKIVSLFDNQK